MAKYLLCMCLLFTHSALASPLSFDCGLTTALIQGYKQNLGSSPPLEQDVVTSMEQLIAFSNNYFNVREITSQEFFRAFLEAEKPEHTVSLRSDDYLLFETLVDQIAEPLAGRATGLRPNYQYHPWSGTLLAFNLRENSLNDVALFHYARQLERELSDISIRLKEASLSGSETLQKRLERARDAVMFSRINQQRTIPKTPDEIRFPPPANPDMTNPNFIRKDFSSFGSKFFDLEGSPALMSLQAFSSNYYSFGSYHCIDALLKIESILKTLEDSGTRGGSGGLEQLLDQAMSLIQKPLEKIQLQLPKLKKAAQNQGINYTAKAFFAVEKRIKTGLRTEVGFPDLSHLRTETRKNQESILVYPVSYEAVPVNDKGKRLKGDFL